jgi:hypothetical protein
MSTGDGNGWSQHQKLVLAELQRLDSTTQQIHRDLSGLRVSVEVLRSRAITWGAVGGLVVWLSSLVIGSGWLQAAGG